jgi:hypothetical protein
MEPGQKWWYHVYPENRTDGTGENTGHPKKNEKATLTLGRPIPDFVCLFKVYKLPKLKNKQL